MGNKLSYTSQNQNMQSQESQVSPSTSPDFITPSSSPFKGEKSAFKPYKKKETRDIESFIQIIDEEFDNCQKDLVEELEKNNIDPDCISTEQKIEFKQKITNDIIYYLHANTIIMHYNINDVNIAYTLVSDNCPSLKKEPDSIQIQVLYWLKDAIKRVEEGKSIPHKIKKKDLFEEICNKWNIIEIIEANSIIHLNTGQKKVLHYMMREANNELFEHHTNLDYFKYENHGYAAYSNMQFIGIFDSIDEILEYCNGDTIFEILVKNFDTDTIDFIK
jgi:hypothetical protein